MTDRIPITTQIAQALVDFVCPEGRCQAMAKTLRVENYISRELTFERGAPKDGIILIKADGLDAFELKEDGTISNLDYQTEYNFCPKTKFITCATLTDPSGKVVKSDCYEAPQPLCENPVKVMIAALFGEEELKNVFLTDAELEKMRRLRETLGLSSREKNEDLSLKFPRASAPPVAAPPKGSFFSDRWKGWRMGGEALFNYYEGPGGGAKIWAGYRKDRWDFRAAVQVEGIKRADAYDVRLGASFDPIFHLLDHPFVWDPYINLPEIGFYHLFPAGLNNLNQEASGLSFSPLGAGLQIHLNDSWSLYAGAKLRAAFTFEEKPKVGAEVPLGFSGHF